jgi:Cytosol aminopeptidase family, N-terminal domain
MTKSSVLTFLVLLVLISVSTSPCGPVARAQTTGAANLSKVAMLQGRSSSITTQVLLQSPAGTDTELQIICLFESTPENTLHGSLAEVNEKLEGLLDQIRNPALFRGELGETLLIAPSTGSLPAKNLLIVGLGDSQTFTPQRMELVGSIAYRESSLLGVVHPYFAPTILDGGVARYSTGEISEKFMTGFLRAARTEKILQGVGASRGKLVQDLTYLAGPAHATDTKQGIERALADSGK